MTDEPARITVSRDALRADLAEMELRLRIYFDAQLAQKADAVQFLDIAGKVDRLDRGDWSEAHRRALLELVEYAGVTAATAKWTRRERIQGALAGALGSGSFALAVILALKSG